MNLLLPNRKATRELARALARTLQSGDLIVLSGALGAGKTFLVRAMCRALGLPSQERVTSPTFALVQHFDCTPKLVHADLYRLEAGGQVWDLGLDAARADAAVVVEWGERFVSELGGDALCVALSREPRSAKITATGERSEAALQQLLASFDSPSPGAQP